MSDWVPPAGEPDASLEYEGRAFDDDHISKLAEQAQGLQLEKLTAFSALAAQMSQYRLLKPEEQSERVDLHRAGRASKQALVQPGLSYTERRDYRKAVSAGAQAQTELVGSMFRLVIVIARELAVERYGTSKGLDLLEDLVGEANIALVKSIDDFDESKCPKFSTYAGRVIRDRVRMCLQESDPIQVPPSWVRLKRIYTVRMPELELELGHTPQEDEIKADLRRVCMQWAAKKLTAAERLLPAGEQLQVMEAKLRKQGMLGAIDRLQEILVTTSRVASLDSPVGDDGSRFLSDSLADPDVHFGFGDAIEFGELSGDLRAALDGLPDREREIVMYRFGFYPPPEEGKDWTYVLLSPIFRVSAERVRQIERNALMRLRGPEFAKLAAHLSSRIDAAIDATPGDGTVAGRRLLAA